MDARIEREMDEWTEGEKERKREMNKKRAGNRDTERDACIDR